LIEAELETELDALFSTLPSKCLGFSLNTDADMLSVFPSVLAAESAETLVAQADARGIPRDAFLLYPPEWTENDRALKNTSALLKCLVLSYYDDEPDDVDPGDDAERPWKREIFFSLVAVIERLRPPCLGVDCFVVVGSPDPNEGMTIWMHDTVVQLNEADLVRRWKAVTPWSAELG